MQILRRILSRILGSGSRLYRFISHCIDTTAIIYQEGLWCWLLFRRLLRQKCDGEMCTLKFKNTAHPFTFRGHPSDIRTIIDNFIREEYGQLSINQGSGWMIDGGAYLGDTSAYFSSKYPSLRIVALEPHPQTFEIAKINIGQYGENIKLLNKGLWSGRDTLFLSGDATSASINNVGFKIDVIGISDIIEKFAIDRIQLLKLDIEGAEKEVLTTGVDQWIHKVDNMIIETHGSDCEEQVIKKCRKYSFKTRKFRNLWYCTKE